MDEIKAINDIDEISITKYIHLNFKKNIDVIIKEYYDANPKSISDRLEEMHVSNAVRRPIIRTLDILKDVVKVQEHAPKRIFVEMARGANEDQKGKRTITRLKQIQELSNEKDQAQKKCEEFKDMCNDIIQKIEENLTDSTRSISDIFRDFAEAFLRLPCKLSLDNVNKNVKLFVPVIDNKPRYDAEELSESQRFFIDYSFRMSILGFFYNGPSFYICETPDSSLDLSYEENAATTLLKYIEKPNSLILTSNLNNSDFIKFLIKKTTKISVLNLLRYGKISAVQTTHQALQNLSNEIEAMINE